MTIRTNQTRLDLLDSLPKGLVIAELGVFCADFSREILQRCSPRKLYLVDTFDGCVSSGDQNGENIRSVDMRHMKWDIEFKLARDPIEVVRSDSVIWLEDRDPDALDIVYIDTVHTFKQTLAELNASLRAVHAGGFICGHDYAPEFSGVINAVDSFVQENSLPLYIYAGDKLPSYRIDKL